MSGPRRFEDFKCITPQTLKVLNDLGFTVATPVQDATIPLFAGNKDVAVDACTGSGKTLAFVVPVIEKLRRLEEPLKRHQVGAIIVSPTRELAKQIHAVAAPFVDSVPGLHSALLVGGTPIGTDVAGLQAEGAQLLVGTPGRLDDVMRRAPWLDYKTLEVLVLDEADRLLEMGFKKQLDAIMARLPKQRRTGLFSATQTEAVEALARAGLRNPVRVNVTVAVAAAAAAAPGQPTPPTAAAAAAAPSSKASKKAAAKAAAGGGTDGVKATAEQQGEQQQVQKTPSTLQLQYVVCEVEEKLPQLVAFLQEHPQEKIIVYLLTCACVEYFGLLLRRLLPALRNQAQTGAAAATAAAPAMPAPAAGTSSGAAAGSATQYGTKKGSKAKAAAVSEAGTLPDAAADAAGAGGDGGMLGGNLMVLALHGKMKQAAREATLEKFAAAPAGVLLATDLAARGLDIPDVSWVVQYDAPQDPAAFVHRVGRTARMGRSGAALAFLMPKEETYVDFLRLRKVPLLQRPALQGAAPLTSWVRQAAERDREVMEKATRAYVSYVRGYKEHHCTYIFRLAELPLGQLATAFGLLRLPRMQELKKAAAGGQLAGFEPSPIDIDAVPYKDKAREKQRQALLKKRVAEAASKQQQQQVPGGAKQQHGQAAAAAAGPGAKLTAAKRRQLQQRDELAELAHDYQLLKKLKRGKISQHAYNVAIGASSSDEEELEDRPQQQQQRQQRQQQDAAGSGICGSDSEPGGSPGRAGLQAGLHGAASKGQKQQQQQPVASKYTVGVAALKLQQKKLKKKHKKQKHHQQQQ